MQNPASGSAVNKHLVIGIIITAIAAFALTAGADIGDKDLILMLAQLMVSGKRLYVDIIEVNPPLVFWFYTMPVSISRVTGFQDYHVLAALVFMIIGLSMWVCLQIMRLHPQFREPGQLSYFLLVLCTIFITCTGLYLFADREHLMSVLIFPYVLSLLPSLSGKLKSRKLATLIGLMAGLGFSIKPHCLIIFAFLQLLWIIRERSIALLFSLQNFLIYAIGSSYLTAVYFLHPEYFTTILPIALVTYPSYNAGNTFIMYLIGPAVTLAVAFSEFRRRNRSPYRDDVIFCLLLCIPLVAYIIMNNGWGYTSHPLSMMVLFITALMWWEYAWLNRDAQQKGLPQKRFLFGARACMLALFANIAFSLITALLLIPQVAYALYPKIEELERMQKCSDLFSEELAASESKVYGIVAIDHSHWPKLARNDKAVLGMRYYNAWIFKLFAKNGAQFEHDHRWILDYSMKGVVEDIRNNKPQLFFVEMSDKRQSFILDYMLRNPDFSEAWQEFAETELSKKSAGDAQRIGCKFAVYKRKPV